MDKIGVLGLGYVGLPLATEFARKFKVIGYDINEKRVKELCSGHDQTLEVPDEKLQTVLADQASDSGLELATDIEELKKCNIFIITVPTPIDDHKTPDFTPLRNATATLASILKKEDLVIYESTVYPGATEEICVPILEKISGLRFNEDFYVGYSPERINPGDKKRT